MEKEVEDINFNIVKNLEQYKQACKEINEWLTLKGAKHCENDATISQAIIYRIKQLQLK